MAKQKTVAPTAATPVIGLGTVKPNFRAGSARALYHARMAQFAGQSVAAFAASVAANPPSMPTKGKLKGQTEPLKGWLGYFTRNGYFTIS